MTTLQGSWIWYELVTPDAAASKAFYEAVAGWTVAPGTAETNGYGFISGLDGAMTGGVMTLTAEMAEHGARPVWLGYVGVDDCDAAVAAVQAAGGKCLMPAFDVPMAGRIALVTDCCGAPFYVMTPNSSSDDEQSAAFSPSRQGACSWNELMAGNAANAISFYTGLFGWTLPEPMDMGPMGKYQFIEHDGVPIGAIMQKPAEMPAAMWNHYLRVPGIAAATETIKAHGGQIVNGPMQVPGDEWIVQGIDPQGAMFSLVGGA